MKHFQLWCALLVIPRLTARLMYNDFGYCGIVAGGYVVLTDAAGTLTRFHIRDIYRFSGRKIVQTNKQTNKQASKQTNKQIKVKFMLNFGPSLHLETMSK